MMNYIIIDDEYIAHSIIRGYGDLVPLLEYKKSCYDAIEAIEYLSSNAVDLVFLDLNMPKLTGFEFLRTLTDPPKVIVTTAYKEFALEGYEYNISDYLLKPFSFERFLKAINKVLSEHSKIQPSIVNKNVETQKIFLRSNKRLVQIDPEKILYIEAFGNYTKVISEDEEIKVREKFSELVNLFKHFDFMQVHKSFAVFKNHIHSIEGNRIFIKDHIIPIGKTYKSNIIQLLK